MDHFVKDAEKGIPLGTGFDKALRLCGRNPHLLKTDMEHAILWISRRIAPDSANRRAVLREFFICGKRCLYRSVDVEDEDAGRSIP